jgi:UDP-N-acetylmuramoyl-tripeptide--D-alanyl-D-alanine ligase
MITAENIYRYFIDYPRVCTDSRNVIPESLFFAIKGEQFNGNLFADDALTKGARYAIVDDPSVVKGENFILVPDALQALQQTAQLHRRHLRAKVIGITGSNGKTTTKELIGRVLGSSYNTITTKGNLNNHIGVPLTLLSLSKDIDFAVIEMGANHLGEIANLCRIAIPDYGLITNIGKAHLEGFGGFEGVIKAKSELYNFIRKMGGVLFVNGDNLLLNKLASGIKQITYGYGENTVCKGEIKERTPTLGIAWKSISKEEYVSTQLYGDYNFENIMAAICVGSHFQIAPKLINIAISSYVPDNNRSQLIRTETNTLFLDAYNANPTSMKAALLHFHSSVAEEKMVVLADMMELGDHSLEEHMEIIDLVNRLGFDQKYFIGEIFFEAADNNKTNFFRNIPEAEEWFKNHPVKNISILLKGSRKMKLENLQKLF